MQVEWKSKTKKSQIKKYCSNCKMENSAEYADLILHSDVFDIDFHPTANVVAAGMIDGVVQA